MPSMNSPVHQLTFQVLGPADFSKVKAFADRRLKLKIPDDIERQFASWKAATRDESLTHYLQLHWCFGAFKAAELCGYYLAQPVLFFRGMTQTLWIEELDAESSEVGHELAKLAFGVAREKNFQRALISPSGIFNAEVLKGFTYQIEKAEMIEVKIAKDN
jgi:hypothetical protein